MVTVPVIAPIFVHTSALNSSVRLALGSVLVRHACGFRFGLGCAVGITVLCNLGDNNSRAEGEIGTPCPRSPHALPGFLRRVAGDHMLNDFQFFVGEGKFDVEGHCAFL